ncbi:MAG: hypothetical protein IJN88_00145, partial [Clostridia bacterium]|nr:hypothetical protein [Clostridia bacterium]
CTVCGTVLDRETVTTSAGQHSWADEGIILPEEAPTCITEGIRRHYCIYDCGWYKEVILPKTDHKYDEGTVVAPTCTNEGYTVYHCTVDGCKASVDKDFVPALDHDYITAVTAPTCDAQGYTTYTCKICTDTFVSDFVKANGHADSNADGNCDHCKTNIIGACKCGCHSTNWFIRIIYMIVRFIWKLFKLNPVCHCGLAHY